MLNARITLSNRGFVGESKISVGPGEVLGLWGDSGCGKTSLLRSIAGLEQQPHSEVIFNNLIWQNDRKFLPVYERRIGFVFQSPSLFEFKNVEQNLRYGLERAKKDFSSNTWFENIVKLPGVSPLLKKMPSTLSGGQLQRVALARALCMQPQLLLLDEPITALDKGSKLKILPFLEEIIKDFAIPCIYVSHSLEEVARISDRIAVMEEGRITKINTASELLADLDFIADLKMDSPGVFYARVAEIDEDFGLMTMKTALGMIRAVKAKNVVVGDRMTISISPRDVSVGLEPKQVSSILNRLEGKISEIIDIDVSQSFVKISIKDTYLVAKVTRKSRMALELKRGDRVFAQIKSLAIV